MVKLSSSRPKSSERSETRLDLSARGDQIVDSGGGALLTLWGFSNEHNIENIPLMADAVFNRTSQISQRRIMLTLSVGWNE